MINTVSTYPTQSKLTSRGSSHFHISDPYKYCRELDLVIQVAKSKGYLLPTDYQLKVINFAIEEKKLNGIFNNLELLYFIGLNHPISMPKQSSNATTYINGGLASLNKEGTIFNFCSLNIINPLNYQLTTVRAGSATKIIKYHNTGASFFNWGVGEYEILSTQWSPSLATKYAQNDAHFSLLLSNELVTPQTNAILGIRRTVATTHTTSFANFDNSINIRGNINRGASSTGVYTSSLTNGYGQYSLERTISTSSTAYKNGQSVGTVAGNSGVITGITDPFIIGTENVNATPTNTAYPGSAYMHFQLGSSLGSTLQKIDYEIMKEFRTRLGFTWTDAI